MTSSSFDDSSSTMGSHLARMIRQGRSFSGHEKNCVFLNTAAKRSANVSFVSGLDFPDDARAAARVDWDFDGDIDFWISNRNAPQVRFARNDFRSKNHYVAFRLQGTTCNRDAIGARIEVHLANEPRPLVRTLKAGEGYLTQSSKWLHVGLGAETEIDFVTVQWPGGPTQRLSDIEVDRHYRLTQGDAAIQWNPGSTAPGRPVPEISVQAIELPAPTGKAAVFSATQLPLPRMAYETFKGENRSLAEAKPTLLVLWASWCQPCVAELSELSKRNAELEAKGLRVVALSVDKLDMQGGDPHAAKKLIEKIAFPFEAGFATQATVQKLQLVNDYLFGLQKPLPVPTSFLLDDQYRLAAIFRGSASLEQVFAAAEKIDVAPEERRDLSVPFRGRWAGKPKTLRLAPFVVELARAGFVEDASEYVQRMQNQFDRSTILDLVVRLGVRYHRQGMPDHGNLHFQMARKLKPGTVLPELQLAKQLQEQRLYKEAHKLLTEAAAANPRNVAVHNRLAWLLATCPDDSIRNGKKAVELVQAIVADLPKPNATLLDTLAAGNADMGEFDEAVRFATEAHAMAKNSGQFRLAGDIARRINQFRNLNPFRLP